MKVGLFFGSFNPIHIGHLAIANYMLEFTDLSEIWLVVSPQNPFKSKTKLVNENERLRMVELAVEADYKIKPTDIEFRLPKPSYTIDTLTYLAEKYPAKEFVLIIGSDNLEFFHKWKNYEIILNNYSLYVYPRPGHGLGNYENHKNVKPVNAPRIEISSSFIREAVKEGKDIRFFLSKPVYDYITQMHFYEK
ncbi:MAG: nicotinic acid mononucleotide adenylyltransferase [Bacteroidetes bacterium GWC2_33_15]|nr:MAG: nicotinic acid mononucleotide adenylyltransferase [Bacteroidetes bacterium GWA2_33_15]OFX51024.1 MAG: nicotinic acid mononucleotide adenylyltransferase [Bacteroidetes bacterium GWC2_33_15]OFX65647.1 MAG: nicotinic acid mononucleotide adenylyltransferase [Bacteroidetes bacterium GWB2_32_14]OFX70232.1 MAG: nicotinic acid mononucleotide adenylyltransferase [Bacteroidetes bacterium GWD2_33_33]HAN17227.1 nicotinic acid mononucleotide adenylyltransferase [Bacteroidales bacterium]